VFDLEIALRQMNRRGRERKHSASDTELREVALGH